MPNYSVMEAHGYDMDDEQDQTLDTDDVLDDLEGSADADGTNDAPPSTDNDSAEAESKRIRDLTSLWQKAEARAKKAEAAAARAQGRGMQTKGRTASAEIDEFAAFAREDARLRLHRSDPRFEKYGIEPTAISGTTLEEMKASFDAQRKVVDGLESRIRNEVLREHGFDLDVGGSNTESALPDFGSMSPEDFAKFVERRDGLL